MRNLAWERVNEEGKLGVGGTARTKAGTWGPRGRGVKTALRGAWGAHRLYPGGDGVVTLGAGNLSQKLQN